MEIEAGYDITFECDGEVPMLLMLSVHPTRRHDLLDDGTIRFSPAIASREYVDVFGNVCTRLTAPAGPLHIASRFIIAESWRS